MLCQSHCGGDVSAGLRCDVLAAPATLKSTPQEPSHEVSLGRCTGSTPVQPGDRSRSGREFDGGGEVALLVGDGADVAADVADAGDAGPVADVTVVQDDVAAGGVPADVAWRGIIAVGHPGHGQPGIESRDLLHGVEVTEVQGQREPVDERSGGSVVPQFGGNDGSPDHDMNR